MQQGTRYIHKTRATANEKCSPSSVLWIHICGLWTHEPCQHRTNSPADKSLIPALPRVWRELFCTPSCSSLFTYQQQTDLTLFLHTNIHSPKTTSVRVTHIQYMYWYINSATSYLQVVFSRSLPALLEWVGGRLAEGRQASPEETSRFPTVAGCDYIHSLWQALNNAVTLFRIIISHSYYYKNH